MELKRRLLLSLALLTIHTPSTSAFSINDVLDKLQPYLPLPFPPLQAPSNPVPSTHPSSDPGAIVVDAFRPATFPCCICSGCTCSPTSCPRIVHPPPGTGLPPLANWPVERGTPKSVAAAGCGGDYGLEDCLSFVQQYLQALQPALEVASKRSHSYSHGGGYEQEEEEDEEKKKERCCGDGCSDAQCLGYLAKAVRDLQAPINGTLVGAGDDDTVSSVAGERKGEL